MAYTEMTLLIEVLCMDRMTGHRVSVPCIYRTCNGRLQVQDLDRYIRQKINKETPDLFPLEPCEIVSEYEFEKSHPEAFKLYLRGVGEGLWVCSFII